MRRLACLFAVSALAGCAEEPPTTPQTETRVVPESAPRFDRESTIEARVLETADHQIARVLGRFPPAQGESLEPVDRARSFLTAHAKALGLPAALDGELILSRRSDDAYGSSVVHQQLHRGVPVFGGEVLVGLDAAGDIVHVENAFVRGLDVVPIESLSAEEAIFSAEVELGAELDRALADPLLMIFEGRLAWRVFAGVAEPRGSWVLFIDAHDGRALRRFDLLRHAGPPCVACAPGSPQCASLLMQSPVEALNDVNVRDSSNVDAAQRWCTLSQLTSSTVLTGAYANTTRTVTRKTAPFDALRSVNPSALNEVTTYFHVTRSKAYVDSLGFPGVMSYSLPINAFDPVISRKNAFYDPLARYISFGINGTDLAQDVDVIYHEVGHAIQDNQVPFWGVLPEGGAMGEGFGDYWAGALNEDIVVPQLGAACLAPWFAVDVAPYNGTFGTGCLRRLDSTKIYPRDLEDEVHADGEMWSASLWRLRNAVGGAVADPLVLKSHTFQTMYSEMMAGADAIISADEAMFAGAHRAQIHAAFAVARIPRTGRAASPLFMSQSVPYSCGSPVNSSGVPYSTPGTYLECRFTQPGAERIRVHYAFGSLYGSDHVRVSDGLYREVAVSSGALGTHSASVMGDTIVVRMLGENLATGYGFVIDRVEYALPRPCTTNADCDDQDVCTGLESCESGFCKVGYVLDCDDDSRCTVDSCNAISGCSHVAVPNGEWCGNDLLCDGEEVCVDGVCRTGQPMQCADNNECNGVEFCAERSPFCFPGRPTVCNDGNPCTIEQCVPGSGCVASPAPNGTPCGSTDPCSGVQTCSNGACVTAPPLQCDDNNACTIEFCLNDYGCYSFPAWCDDFEPCNGAETCDPQIGCVPGQPLQCYDYNACNGEESCEPYVGCVAGQPLVCDDAAMCNGTYHCEPYGGGCVMDTPPINCDNWDPCDGVAICTPGGCVPGEPLFCWDDICGFDLCVPGYGCAYNVMTDGCPVCGNNICDPDENITTCPQDCSTSQTGSYCGDSICSPSESSASCAQDCGVVVTGYCGDTLCLGVEDCASCPNDCGSCQYCGNLVCEIGEDCWSCALDCGGCGPVCGNWGCEAGEDCSNCPSDCGGCGPVCGNSVCELGEDCWSCALDCGGCAPVCGNWSCEAGEDCSTCVADCGYCAYCGDGWCAPGEDCAWCPADCGACSSCGDSSCNNGEDCSTCTSDCGTCTHCGDGACDASESCWSCASDCGSCSTCGDGTCNGDESCSTCASDCGMCWSCGDGLCSGGEDCASCAQDCGSCSYCSDGACNSGEDCWNCPFDCGTCSYCGDGSCGEGEYYWNCAYDCGWLGGYCGDSTCSSAEDCSSCAQDCGACQYCGDAICNDGETCSTCAQDCGACSYCGDWVCNPGEDCWSCSFDCGTCSYCGDWICSAGEDYGSCPFDCTEGTSCGDGLCIGDEDSWNCATDCHP